MYDVTIERELTNDEIKVVTLEDVESFNNPPVTSTARVTYADGRQEKVAVESVVKIKEPE